MASRRPVRHKLQGHLAVDTEMGSFLGDPRVRLLEAIARHGSISQAAKAVPLSYKAAWDAIDAMNNLADQALVERSTGGHHGGGTVLTDYGHRLVAMYRALEGEYQAALDRLSASLAQGAAGDLAQFQRLLRRMAVRSSARNQFVGTVCHMQDTPGGYAVHVRLDDASQIVATITRESAERLELALGTEVYAYAKATAVTLALAPRPAAGRTVLRGVVQDIEAGPLNAEVRLALAGGTRVLAAVISRERLAQLGLAPGVACGAVIDASAVTLLRFD